MSSDIRRGNSRFLQSPLGQELSTALILKRPGCSCVKSMCNILDAYHMQDAECHVVGRDSSAVKFDRVKIAFVLALFHWLKMPHTRARKFKPQPRLDPTLKHWWKESIHANHYATHGSKCAKDKMNWPVFLHCLCDLTCSECFINLRLDSRLSLGNISEGSPVASRRALAVQQV